MSTEIPADDADARARAQWQRNKWTIAVDLGMALLFFVVGKMTESLVTPALVCAGAGLALIVIQRFVKVDLLGGLALFGVIVRKAYGLGVQAMCGASALVGFFTVAWPTAEFSGMNIEGSVKLGYRKELAAIDDPEQRRAEFDRRVAQAYDTAKAVNAAAGGGIDDVIDPSDTRDWIANSLRRLPPVPERTTKKYPFIDTW
jgi:hypothetical protein